MVYSRTELSVTVEQWERKLARVRKSTWSEFAFYSTSSRIPILLQKLGENNSGGTIEDV